METCRRAGGLFFIFPFFFCFRRGGHAGWLGNLFRWDD
jgi:hypothetical protein